MKPGAHSFLLRRVFCHMVTVPSVLLCICYPIAFAAQPIRSNLICRPDLVAVHSSDLASKLRKITGWRDLGFNEQGNLLIGGEITGGSKTARELLIAATKMPDIIVLQDASGRDDVAFARVTPGQWREGNETKPPVHIMLIDFSDFSQLTGDKAARAAFDAGWVVLHELAHVVHDYDDTENLNEVGACEAFINKMRRECGLAERAEYFHTLFPGLESSDQRARLVRMPFVQQISNEQPKKRYWLIWDANLVGGLRDYHQANTQFKLRP